ncbi:type VI secretion system-associated protein TagF [Aliikangiella coralliicola]|uniref:Type VI secretion system-associated protein TagF n=1 Tax=Aliikangiella coralliicola TaxID=2592383 RepID=A0A545U8Y6_9GAMM|nr:type VI secretion system-associated protein TagF [Aliikangiella coralliicola]TQV85873.1 type VI secretion system-associated protein TagF [Aliikangiella coralliicola]
MDTEKQIGVYGKLPLHGDFIHRNLPTAFINTWDNWLQLFIAGSKEQMGEDWLDIYLTSPIWRFVLSAGVIDEHHWAGIVLPSVDQVGRYYPFSITMPLTASINPLEFLSLNSNWYEQIEELALQALDEQFQVDELVEAASAVKNNFVFSYQKTGQRMEGNSWQVNMQFEEELPMSVYAHLLDSVLLKTMSSYSVWTTSGSERITPCLFSVQGLPSVNNVPAMMDGQWSHWGWPQTYVVK